MNLHRPLLLSLGFLAFSSPTLASDQPSQDDDHNLAMSWQLAYAGDCAKSPEEIQTEALSRLQQSGQVEKTTEKENDAPSSSSRPHKRKLTEEDDDIEITGYSHINKKSKVEEKERVVVDNDIVEMGERYKEITIKFNNFIDGVDKDEYNEQHQLYHLKKTFEENSDTNLVATLSMPLTEVVKLRQRVEGRIENIGNFAKDAGVLHQSNKDALIAAFMTKDGCSLYFATKVYNKMMGDQ